jgi:nucleotide-binding universal stress UspA family protein
MVGYDFSEYSKKALEYAVELAEDLKAEIIIAHIINEREVNGIRMAAMVSTGIFCLYFKHIISVDPRGMKNKKVVEPNMPSKSRAVLPGPSQALCSVIFRFSMLWSNSRV